jgi:hypothetical protein
LRSHVDMHPQRKADGVQDLFSGHEPGCFDPYSVCNGDPLPGPVKGIRCVIRDGGSVAQKRRQLDQVERPFGRGSTVYRRSDVAALESQYQVDVREVDSREWADR